MFNLGLDDKAFKLDSKHRQLPPSKKKRLWTYSILVPAFILQTSSSPVSANTETSPTRLPLSVKNDDVIATGNEWISLPTIRAADGAITSFNMLSMRDRGLLEVVGAPGEPVIKPFLRISGKAVELHDLQWELIEYWIPVAHFKDQGLDLSLTYCAPPGARAAFLRVAVKNESKQTIPALVGLNASWGGLNRITYTPVRLRGERRIAPAPWVDPAEAFSFITHDTHFAWSIVHPDSSAKMSDSPESLVPSLQSQRELMLAPGESAECNYIIGGGVEEFSGPHNAKSLREMIDREGSENIIKQAAAWCHERTRSTGQPDLDFIMNRNFLFTALYAWGKTIDTEQLVGVTSRSPRYYVSAAYWDRDAMIWSFPGLLDIDRKMAREALEYALTIQLRNAGTHSRFIDGIVLEDGLQLDELVAPLFALCQYVQVTNDDGFLRKHRDALENLHERLEKVQDPLTGLYSTLQDSQDEFQALPFSTYDNVLSWRVLTDLSGLYVRLGEKERAQKTAKSADLLKQAILKYCIADGAEGAGGAIYANSTDGKKCKFAEVPPGSLMKLPILGFVSETDPVFVRTYDWLHSKNHKYSYSDKTYGLPGSYRLPITTSWSLADHLRLARGRDQALKILRASNWDGGIISEGLNPSTGVMDYAGRAFATAAGYVAHSIYETFAKDKANSVRPAAQP